MLLCCVVKTSRKDHNSLILAFLLWLPVKSRIEFKTLFITYKALGSQGTLYLKSSYYPNTNWISTHTGCTGTARSHRLVPVLGADEANRGGLWSLTWGERTDPKPFPSSGGSWSGLQHHDTLCLHSYLPLTCILHTLVFMVTFSFWTHQEGHVPSKRGRVAQNCGVPTHTGPNVKCYLVVLTQSVTLAQLWAHKRSMLRARKQEERQPKIELRRLCTSTQWKTTVHALISFPFLSQSNFEFCQGTLLLFQFQQ